MTSLGQMLEQTLAHYEKKEYVEAEKGANALLAAYPDFSKGLFLKAVILEETGRASEAESYYQKAGPLFSLWLRLAMQLEEVDPERALRYFDKTVNMDPANNLVWFGMGKAYEKLGRNIEARTCFQKIALQQEVITKIVGPAGFLVLMVVASVMLLQRGNFVLTTLVVLSAAVCVLWLRRDGGRVLQMMKKKKKYS